MAPSWSWIINASPWTGIVHPSKSLPAELAWGRQLWPAGMVGKRPDLCKTGWQFKQHKKSPSMYRVCWLNICTLETSNYCSDTAAINHVGFGKKKLTKQTTKKAILMTFFLGDPIPTLGFLCWHRRFLNPSHPGKAGAQMC